MHDVACWSDGRSVCGFAIVSLTRCRFQLIIRALVYSLLSGDSGGLLHRHT